VDIGQLKINVYADKVSCIVVKLQENIAVHSMPFSHEYKVYLYEAYKVRSGAAF